VPPQPQGEPVPPSNIESGRIPDPHGFGPATQGLSTGTQKRAKPAVVAAAMALEPGELVRAVVCGEYLAHDGVAVLTDKRILFINSRTFAPDMDSIPLAAITDVKGWAESNRATLRVSGAGLAHVLGDIKEIDAAQAFAVAVRANV
jgi:hypothetical protein